jgi:hypothetical protein
MKAIDSQAFNLITLGTFIFPRHCVGRLHQKPVQQWLRRNQARKNGGGLDISCKGRADEAWIIRLPYFSFSKPKSARRGAF